MEKFFNRFIFLPKSFCIFDLSYTNEYFLNIYL